MLSDKRLSAISDLFKRSSFYAHELLQKGQIYLIDARSVLALSSIIPRYGICTSQHSRRRGVGHHRVRCLVKAGAIA